jgi:outer membrane cobalamin receptor
MAQRATISGYVRDNATGESLIGATVYLPATKSGTTSNAHGFYSITLSGDSARLIYSYVGYQPQELRVSLKADTDVNITLINANQLDEVVVNAAKADEIHAINRMSTVNIPVEQIKALPSLLGEVDVLKVIQLMPGVKSSEGSTGLYVRGGGPDQNLMLLDGVPIYNASHLFGFFSVFNADAINRVDLIKGGFPARYGGRLSSVIDINMKDGNMKEVHAEGSAGIIAAKITVEGPIVKDKTSILVSARRTYIDLLARPIIQAASKGDQVAGYYFYDLNLKLNHIINSRNRIYLSTYTGDDKAYSIFEDEYFDGQSNRKSREEFGLKWGNIITAFRWNHLITPKLFANTTMTFSRYRFLVFDHFKEENTSSRVTEEYKTEYTSGIRDWAGKVDFDYLPGPNHYIKFGVSGIAHRFAPGVATFRSDVEQDTTVGDRKIPAVELSLYAEDDIRLTDRLKLNVGGHVSAFNVDNTWYYSVQPRISSRYLIGREWSVKASYATMAQFIHLLTNAGLGLPTDLWVPSTGDIKPQTAEQLAVGVAKSYKSAYEFSVEGYYKWMNNLIDYKDGASFLNIEESWENKIVTGGKGESYGAEVLLQKKTGHITGWVGYTLSWTERQFEELNEGKWYPYRYDRRHDVSVAASHTWNDRMDFSMAWVYGTGNAVTIPVSQYPEISGAFGNNWYNAGIYNYDGRNGFRMRSYHRLDLSFSFWKNKKWGQSKWTVGAYNVYSRRNPFYMDLTYDRQGNRKFVQYSLFPIIPSISYSFKF